MEGVGPGFATAAVVNDVKAHDRRLANLFD